MDNDPPKKISLDQASVLYTLFFETNLKISIRKLNSIVDN